MEDGWLEIGFETAADGSDGADPSLGALRGDFVGRDHGEMREEAL
jgi:hypothetical protein